MTTEKECVSNARDCVRLSGLTTDQELRDWLLDIARQWMNAAKQQRIAHAVNQVLPKQAA
jgi:hypothetical protein